MLLRINRTDVDIRVNRQRVLLAAITTEVFALMSTVSAPSLDLKDALRCRIRDGPRSAMILQSLKTRTCKSSEDVACNHEQTCYTRRHS